MKILYLCHKTFWDHKMSRVRFQSMDAIGRHPEIELIKSGPGWPEFQNVKDDVDKYKPDLVVWYKPCEIPGFDQINNVPRCLRYNEMWHKQNTNAEIINSKSELVIHHHANDVKNYTDLTNVTFYNNPHCAEKEVFKDHGEEKIYDVQLAGIISPPFYPLRSKFQSILSNLLNGKVKWRLMPHPGYHINDVNVQIAQYSKELNKAKITMTCSSTYKYALAKHVEIPMSGSLLYADIPDENQDWYRSWMLEVKDEDTDQQIADKVLEYVNDDTKREALIKKGMEENLNNRTQEHYANRFVDIVKDFLKK